MAAPLLCLDKAHTRIIKRNPTRTRTQYGTLIWLAPGYGLFAGWIVFATALSCSVAISYNSYPAGTLPWPETRTEYTPEGGGPQGRLDPDRALKPRAARGHVEESLGWFVW